MSASLAGVHAHNALSCRLLAGLTLALLLFKPSALLFQLRLPPPLCLEAFLFLVSLAFRGLCGEAHAQPRDR